MSGLVITKHRGKHSVSLIGDADSLRSARRIYADSCESAVGFIPIQYGDDAQINAFLAVLELAIDAGPDNRIEKLLTRILEAGRKSAQPARKSRK